MRRRLWCPHCRQRALFPVLHFVVHTLDMLRGPARAIDEEMASASGND
jgi:hypothetical protein